MIDFNGNRRIDPEEVVLTEILLDEEKTPKRPGGCLTALLTLPLLLLKGWFS